MNLLVVYREFFGSPAKVVMNPVQSPEYQYTESHSSLLVQDYRMHESENILKMG